jgi:transcriptional regulator with XRE-family HTH domain
VNFREERLNRGLSLRDMAVQIGVTHDVLFRIEQGAIPQPRHRLLIANYFDAKVTELWPDLKVAA